MPLQGAKKKTLLNANEDDDDDDDDDVDDTDQVNPVEEDNEAQLIMTTGPSPPNVGGRMVGISKLGGVDDNGDEAAGGENSFYVQSSKDVSYDEQQSNQEDLEGGVRMMLGDSVKEPRRQFKVREPEDLGTSLTTHTQNVAAQDI